MVVVVVVVGWRVGDGREETKARIDVWHNKSICTCVRKGYKMKIRLTVIHFTSTDGVSSRVASSDWHKVLLGKGMDARSIPFHVFRTLCESLALKNAKSSNLLFAHAEYGELSANSNNVDYIFEDVVRSCLQLESKRHLSLKYVVVEEEEEKTTNEEAKTIVDTIYL